MKKPPDTVTAAEPPRSAEQELSTKPEPGNAADMQKLLHELQARQIQLERQNAELQDACAEAEKLKARCSDFYEYSPVVLIGLMQDGTIAQINLAGAHLLGFDRGHLLNKRFDEFVADADLPAYNSLLEQAFSTGAKQTCEVMLVREGRPLLPVWIEATLSPNSPHCLTAVLDISERKQSEELVWQQANFDSLTGLPNRRMFHDRLEQEVRKAHRANMPLALMFLDLDRFKEINDTFGHGMGDLLLIEAARRLSSCVRESDTVARLGGDEFTLIIGALDEPGSIERAANDILQKLAEPFLLGDESVRVSASIGITLYPEDAIDIEELLKNADQAMYAAKRRGRNCYHYFTPFMQKAAQIRKQIANEMREALADNQFVVHYQPIVELTTGAIYKAEALIRWQHPAHGLFSPDAFLPVAEETGMIIDIGDWVFREALRQAERWRAAQHAAFQITVNKSLVEFHQSPLHEPWLDHLRKLGLSGQSIAVEFTEKVLMEANDDIKGKLIAFRDLGVQVSLDDFGAGYSSLSHLKKFDIDYLNIDQSFVTNLVPESDDMALCEAIIVMAHKLGLKVIAKGIETEEQRDLLAAAGCDYGQGYYFSKPVPADQFEALLQNPAR